MLPMSWFENSLKPRQSQNAGFTYIWLYFFQVKNKDNLVPHFFLIFAICMLRSGKLRNSSWDSSLPVKHHRNYCYAWHSWIFYICRSSTCLLLWQLRVGGSVPFIWTDPMFINRSLNEVSGTWKVTSFSEGSSTLQTAYQICNKS